MENENVEKRLFIVNKQRVSNLNRLKFEKLVQRSMTTTFIGDIDRVERFFGALWGHGKEESELTPKERQWLEIWKQCRNEMLNNGNNQLRNLQSKLNSFNLEGR